MAAGPVEALAAVLEAVDAWYALGIECTERAGAWLLRDARCPDVWDANHARRLRDGVDPAALFAALDDHYRAMSHRCVRLDARGRGGVLERELSARGYGCELLLLMQLDGDVAGRRARVRLAPVEGDGDWACYWRLKRADFAASGLELAEDDWVGQLRRKSPAVRFWLAFDGADALGFFSEFVHGGVGVLEDLYVDPRARGRGVGTALVAHCAAEARRRGAGPCVLSARADDTVKHMYAGQGFRRVGETRSFVRRAPGPGSARP